MRGGEGGGRDVVKRTSVEKAKSRRSPIVKRYIHSAEFTHKAIFPVKRWNPLPPPSPATIRTATHRFCCNVNTRHLRSHFLAGEKEKSYNLLHGKGICHLPCHPVNLHINSWSTGENKKGWKFVSNLPSTRFKVIQFLTNVYSSEGNIFISCILK